MVVQGQPKTLPVTLDEMIYTRGNGWPRGGACVAHRRTMPFPQLPLGRRTEGNRKRRPNAQRNAPPRPSSSKAASSRRRGDRRASSAAAIPVMAHCRPRGRRPSTALGGHRVQGRRDERSRESVLADAQRRPRPPGPSPIVLEVHPGRIAPDA